MDRRTYAETFGPTAGDHIWLADTELIIEVERALTSYGDQVKFGGSKVIRDGMGQSPISRADGAVDGEGMILTAGELNVHIHVICPQQMETAIASQSKKQFRSCSA